MNITYSFTCGRLETIYRICNALSYGNDNLIIREQQIIEHYRKDILILAKRIEDTQLFQELYSSEIKIIQNRVKRAFKEDTGLNYHDRIAFEYQGGVKHELMEYKLSRRLNAANEMLVKKHLEKTGMNLTSRDLESIFNVNSSTIRAMLAHKRDVLLPFLEKIEKYSEEY